MSEGEGGSDYGGAASVSDDMMCLSWQDMKGTAESVDMTGLFGLTPADLTPG